MKIGGDTGVYLRGVAFALAATSIWAAWMPVTRLSVPSSLTPLDLVLLRFVVASLIPFPVLIDAIPRLKRMGWW